MDVVINGIYKHFKGNVYQVICIAKDSETLDELVIYKDINSDKIWARKKDMFLSKVDKIKYPNINQEYRFEYIKKG
ncbi:MAG: DUF1653 domain-containing protein [bacterium]|nr:DUF1653 domain-containing protein [bacterium]